MTLASARRVTSHIQAISHQFSKFGPSVRLSLDQQTLNTLVVLLSHSLQATGHRPGTFSRVDGGAEPDSHEENIRNASSVITSCLIEEPLSAQQVVQLVTDVLEATADLMLVRDIWVQALCSLTPIPTSIHLFFFQFPEVHLASRGSGASSPQPPHCFTRHTPEPNRRSHQR